MKKDFDRPDKPQPDTCSNTGDHEAVRHMTQADLSHRWKVSPRTLERWRATGKGPCWLKLCGRVVYRLADVRSFEERHLHGSQGD